MAIARPRSGGSVAEQASPSANDDAPPPVATGVAGAGARRASPSASVARGALALFSAQPLTWGASILTTIFVPHFLGDQALGQYAVAVTLAGLVTTVVSLGVPGYLTRRIATHPEQARAAVGSAVVLLVSVAVGLAGILALLLPLVGFHAAPAIVIRLTLVGAVLGTVQGVVWSLLIGAERHRYFAWLNAGGVLISACAGVGVLAVGGGLTALVAVGAVTSSGLLLLSWRIAGLGLDRTAFDRRLLRRLVHGGVPFLLWSVAIQVRAQIDVIVVAVVLRAQVAGWLSAAYRVISIPVFIPTLIATPLFPALSRHADDPAVFGKTLHRSLIAVLLLTVPASGLVFALAPAVPGLFHWGPSFRNAVPLMQILAFQQPLVALDTILGTALFALGRERRWARVAVIAAMFNPSLNLVTIPLFERWLENGAIGAALVELATEALMLAGALMLMPRGILDRRTAAAGGRIAVAGACLVMTTMVLRSLWLPAALAAGGLTFVAAVVGLGVVRAADIRQARGLALGAMRRRVVPADLAVSATD